MLGQNLFDGDGRLRSGTLAGFLIEGCTNRASVPAECYAELSEAMAQGDGGHDWDAAVAALAFMVENLPGGQRPAGQTKVDELRLRLRADCNEALATLATEGVLQQNYTPQVWGQKVHRALEFVVGLANDGEVWSEISYKDGIEVSHGTPGSVRPDIVLGPKDAPLEILDLKTGKTGLLQSWITKVGKHVPGGKNVPVHAFNC